MSGMHDPREAFDARYADIYDLIYAGRGKDYAAEAAELAALVRKHRPEASSLLDVACGTGRHLENFATVFDHVEGAELADDMLAMARARLPAVPLHLADMRELALGRTFDAVTCLFAATGHLRTTDELATVAERLVAHVVPGGVVIVEPWWFPENFLPNYVTGDVVTEDGATIARVSHTTEAERVTTMEVHYVVARPDSRPWHFTNEVVNTLFTREEYEHALASAGCDVHYLPEGPSGRGRFVAVRR
jgi:trans-aconitate methyltransferase